MMLKPLDLYTHEQTAPLAPFGQTTIKYEFRKYHDVRNLKSAFAYMLVCTQRIIVAGATAYEGGPINQTDYSDYPAIIVNQIIPTLNNKATAVVKTMFPRTLNTAVSTSVDTLDAQSNTTESQKTHTSGSSTSNTNTFSLISLDMFQHGGGKEKETSRSRMSGQTSSQESSISSGDEMSIKDWSSYGYLTGSTITWLWGQTYPWDVLQYNQGTDNNDGTSTITLPNFVQSRLLDKSLTPPLVLPPSSLSLYGCDFTMKAGWLIEFPNGISGRETISLQHNMVCYTASHSAKESLIVATLQNPPGLDKNSNDAQPVTITTSDLDMSTYALDPITTPSARNGAIIGFTSNHFTYPPNSGKEFKIISSANNLQVTGSGFDAGLLTTTFTQTPSLKIQFKIIDSASAYSLLLKHWICPSSSACKMTFTINKVQTQTVTIYVEATEGQGGQNNLSVIDLRNLHFASINFHDYLVVGLNTIDIAIEPVDPSADNQYTLFALAVGRA